MLQTLLDHETEVGESVKWDSLAYWLSKIEEIHINQLSI